MPTVLIQRLTVEVGRPIAHAVRRYGRTATLPIGNHTRISQLTRAGALQKRA